MDNALAKIWPLLLAAVMTLTPLAGPMLDHHFAERQPYHAHLGADANHRHDYRSAHDHAGERSGEGGVSLYSIAAASAAPAAALIADSELARRLAPGDSTLAIRARPQIAPASALTPPQWRPPRAALAVSVSL